MIEPFLSKELIQVQIEDKELGIIQLIPNVRSQRIIVRCKEGVFTLTHPPFVSQEEILKTIEEMKPDLLKFQERAVPPFVFTESTSFKTLTFDVEIVQHAPSTIKVLLKDGILTINYPQSLILESEQIQNYIKNIIENVCRSEANRILPARTKVLAREHGFEVGTVKINKSRGRWGSCSSKKNVNLSYFCLMIPNHLVDFVILHELCHTKEMNHGPRFWAELDRVSGNRANELTKELKMIKLLW